MEGMQSYENELPGHFTDSEIDEQWIECVMCDTKDWDYDMHDGICQDCYGKAPKCWSCNEIATTTDYDEDTGVIEDCCEGCK